MRLAQIICIGTALACGSASALTFTTEDAPPYNFSKDGKMTGSATDIMNEMLKRTGLQATITLLPWERAYSMGKDDKDTCVYSTTRTEPRESLFKWVGPLADNNWVLFAKMDSPIKIDKLDDAKKYKIGGYQGDAVAVFLQSKGFKVDETIKDPQNVDKLEAGRIDLWASGSQGGPFIAKQHNPPVKVKPVFNIKETQLYLACNKGMGDDLIKKMNDAIGGMIKDGTTQKIFAKYH